jgi:Protein of unknown function (DUF3040)
MLAEASRAECRAVRLPATHLLPCESIELCEGVIVPSHDDRRRLAEIERGLHDDDPRLAHSFDAWSVPRDWRWLAISLIAVGLTGTIAGTFALSGATIVLLGFVPVAAGIALWYSGGS